MVHGTPAAFGCTPAERDDYAGREGGQRSGHAVGGGGRFPDATANVMKSNPEILILRAALADVGISAASLARAAGLSPSLLQEILADRRRLTEAVQSRLALALDNYAQRATLAADAIRSIEADM
jgi:hypothetical protein